MDDSLVLTDGSTHETSETAPDIGDQTAPYVAVDSSFVDGSSSNTMNQSFVSSRGTPFIGDNNSFDRDISALLDDSVFKGGVFKIFFIFIAVIIFEFICKMFLCNSYQVQLNQLSLRIIDLCINKGNKSKIFRSRWISNLHPPEDQKIVVRRSAATRRPVITFS